MFDAIAPSPERSRGAPPSPNFLCEDEKGNIYILSKKRRENGRVDTTITSDRSRRAAQHAAGVASLEDVRVYSGIPSSSLSSNGEEEEKEEVRTLEVSSGGQFAILVSARENNNTKKTSRVYVVRLQQDDQVNAEGGNKSYYDILPKYFESAPSATVLSAKFCPGTEESIAMLTSDGYFRIVNFTRSCSAPEQIWKMDPSNEHSSSTPIRPQVVDFTFGPPSGWGRFTVFFLCATEEKKVAAVKCMCPIVASGSRTSSRVLDELAKDSQMQKGGGESLQWLERTFDMTSKASVRVARKLSANASGGEAVALQDFLTTSSASSMHSHASRGNLKIAVRSLSGDGRGDDGFLIATLQTDRLIVSAITTALTPLWTSRESRTIEGILHASSTSGDRHASPTPILCDVDVIKLENSAQDGGSTTIYDSCQKVEWDTFIKQRLFATLKGSVHSVDLRWLPILEAAVAREEGLKLDSISDDLPLPEVKRVLSGSCSATDCLLGAISLGDPLEAGLILAIHSSQGVLALTPEDVSTATMDVSKSPLETVPKKMNDTSNVTGEALKKLSKGPEATFNAADTINKYSSAAFDTNTKFSGTDEDANSEIMTVLSKSFADLKAHHVSFGHRAHDEIRAAGSRLGREITRQIEEATTMAEMSNTLTNNLDALGTRFDDAVERHGKIRARLVALVESERNLPGMLSRAESLFERQLETYKGDVDLIESRVDELVDRCDVVCGEEEKIGYVGTGKRDEDEEDEEGEISLSDKLLREELQRQSDAIQANAFKLKVIEKILLSTE